MRRITYYQTVRLLVSYMYQLETDCQTDSFIHVYTKLLYTKLLYTKL